jgi:glycosyltransferase involved in cell wall biosynthesis
MVRTDLTTLLMAVASAPFRLLGLDFRSPIDYFLLQSSCLAPLGPLIKRLSEKLSGKKISVLLFLAFTPYWYFGIVGREWPLYYIAILVTLIFLSNNRSIIYVSVALMCLYLSFLVRFESMIIFSIFVLFHIRKKTVFLFIATCLTLTLLYTSDYVNGLLDFAISKSQLIYFSKIEQSTGFGGALKYSDSFILKLFFILYLIISPIPPYLYHSQTVENILLFTGHLMWPIFVFIIVFNFNRFASLLVDSVGIRSAVAGFSVVILLLAFYGGTHRHYYPFIPHLFLALPLLFSTQRSFLQALKLPMLGLALLSSLYSFENGGAQNTLIKLANMFEEKGHDVSILVMSSAGPLVRRVNIGVNIIDLKSPRSWLALFPMLAALIRIRPNWLVVSLLTPSILVLLAKIILLGSINVMIREASTPSFNKLKTAKSIILYYLTMNLYKIADRIVAVSKGVKDDLSRFYGVSFNKVDVVYNPVIFDNIKKIRAQRKPYTGPLRLIFVGRVVRIKRLELQIEAVSIVIKQIPGISLVICGNCPDSLYREELQLLAIELGVHESIIWAGFQTDIYHQLNNSDCLLLTSDVEGLPSVLIEALSVGVRVIAFDCPHGPREILDDGRIGRLIPHSNCTVDTLASVIIEDALNPIPINNYDSHIQKFTSKNIYKEYFRLMGR